MGKCYFFFLRRKAMPAPTPTATPARPTGRSIRHTLPVEAGSVGSAAGSAVGSGVAAGAGRACLSLRNGDRFRLGAAADRADTLLLAFLAFRRLLRDGPVSKGMRAGFREELAAAGIFLRVLRLGDGPFRHAAVYVVRAVDIAVSLAADLALCPPEAGRRAAGMFPAAGIAVPELSRASQPLQYVSPV